MPGEEYKIHINITFSRILDYDDINMESIELTTRKMVDQFNSRFVGLNVSYVGMDIDSECQNLIFVKIMAIFYSSTPYVDHIQSIGKINCTNLKNSLENQSFLEDYFLEKMNFSVYQIETVHRIID